MSPKLAFAILALPLTAVAQANPVADTPKKEIPTVIAIPGGAISLANGVDIPKGVAISSPVDVRVANETDWIPWFWSEAGGAFVGVGASIAALVVSWLTYHVVKGQNKLIETQGASQIALLGQQNTLQSEQGAIQAALIRQQYEFEKRNAEVVLFAPLAIKLHEANRNWRDGILYYASQRTLESAHSLPPPQTALDNYTPRRNSTGKELFSAVEQICYLIDMEAITDSKIVETFDSNLRMWREQYEEYLYLAGPEYGLPYPHFRARSERFSTLDFEIDPAW